ncbi:DUF2339 domain-containing protein [Flavobacterium amniphilum]|uniref:DUF2339 domain-containing protein n=1 Tax=Flavobacterium amniphilum TaxID=1834035 RepID=UPI002029CED0|nr:DUF2339 domain-containing protein [Flavobacterium amniphilum]MCL9806712.1 DUF2339 domain-containing protein [Flavobacterium amniphilum]
MEIFLLLIVLVIVILVLNKVNSKFQNLEDSVSKLHQKINILNKRLEGSGEKAVTGEEKKPDVTFHINKAETKPPVFEKIDEKTQIEEVKEEDKPKVMKPEVKPVPENIPTFTTPAAMVKPKYIEPQKSWFEKFRENNPDLEKFVGENLINKIGILILVLGISFFVKFAIDKNWINETARVGIGILAGSLVMGVAHKLKANYKAFSSVMVAGAISIFYFTIGIAFHDYHLFSQTVAFSIMVVITAFSTFVSLAYDRQELAILSLIGGFAVPFMVSTGQGNYIVLFIYIAILNIGILAIAYFKKWNVLTLLSFLFSTILFLSWYVTELDKNTLPHKGALLFATLFYFLFSITAVLNNLRSKGLFSTMDYFIVVANTFAYFGLGLGIIHNWGMEMKGLFTLSLAVYNLIYAGFLYKRFGLDKNAVYLLIGFVFTFVTITIPVQFEGNQITLFWACEAVLLFWLSQKSGIGLFKLGAVAVQILTVISLILDWNNHYQISGTILSVIFNPACLAGIVVLGSFVVTYLLLKKETDETVFFSLEFNPVFYRNAILWVALCVGYLVGFLEVAYQADVFLSNAVSSLSLPVTYHFVFCAVLFFLGLKWDKVRFFKWITLLITLNLFVYITYLYRIPSDEVQQNILEKLDYSTAFYFHYIILACVIYFMSILVRQILEVAAFDFVKTKVFLWILVFSGVLILSNELIVHCYHFADTKAIYSEVVKKAGKDNYMYDFYIDDALSLIKVQVVKIGYPVLWGVLSFILLIFGIKKQWKDLRIIALSLLGLTIVKLFVYDINNVSETGKIIAFILLGVLILIISFVYQKIKKLVVDENANTVSDEKNN